MIPAARVGASWFTHVACTVEGAPITLPAGASLTDDTSRALAAAHIAAVAARHRIYLPDTAEAMWAYLSRRDTTIPIGEGRTIRGAVLFTAARDHVALAVHPGTVLTAAGGWLGVTRQAAHLAVWDAAARIPGVRYA